MSLRTISVLLLFGLLSACVSQIATIDEHVSGYIGKPISQIQELYLTPQRASIGFFKSKVFAWSEEQKKFKSGDTLYSYTNPYKDCVINWIANKDNIIM